MKKLIISIFLLMPMLASAQTKTWSWHLNAGYGTASVCTLEGLALNAEDAQFFADRGLYPEFTLKGKRGSAPSFNGGVSRYFNQFRVSAQIGTQYLNQSNFHAYNFSADILGGYNFLKSDNFELNLDLGVGLYSLTSNYIYVWEGKQDGEVIETRTCDLGNCNTNSFSIPAKVSALYNVAGKVWIGAYANGRVNTASIAFCPRFVASAGVEARYTLGKSKARRVVSASTYIPEIPQTKAVEKVVHDTIYVEKVVKDTVYISVPAYKSVSIPFEVNSSKLNADAYLILSGINLEGATKLIITGYTDSTANDSINVPLSIARAKSVKDFLNVDIPTMVSGMSSNSPVADNDTAEGRALNRRVEVLILY